MPPSEPAPTGDAGPPGDAVTGGPDDGLGLDEYVPGGAVVLDDAERWPALSAVGRQRLDRVRAHPDAPQWTHAAGDRLTAAGHARAAVPLPTAGWLPGHLATARALPAYRGHPGPLDHLQDFPTIGREDLVRDVSLFVPLDVDLDLMVHGTSSGSTGHALVIPDHLEEVVRGFHLLVSLVEAQGVRWRPDPDRLAVAHVVAQRQAFTYASALPAFGDTVMARLNLAGWPGRAAFLAAHDPQVYTGHPTSLEELLAPDLAPRLHPLAIVSSAMALTAPLRAALHAAYGCPLLDLYGLHETRPIAVSADGGPHVVLDRRLVVEVLGPTGAPVPAGERGEIVVTAGENPLLPLVRYRTGDTGRLVEVGGRPAIADLEGRDPVRFLAADGRLVPSVDLTQQLQAYGARGWTVDQDAAGAVRAVVAGGAADAIGRALVTLLGRPVQVRQVERLADLGPGKPRRYRSEVVTPRPAAGTSG